MDVVILTHRSTRSYYIVNRLDASHKYFVIIEKRRPWRRPVLKMLWFVHSRGLTKGTWSFLKFLSEAPYIRKEKRKAFSYLKEKLGDDRFTHAEAVYTFESVNNEAVPELINRIDPKVVLVAGASIISRSIIERVAKNNRHFVNSHTGIIPEYRGSMMEFHCVLNNELDMVGHTIHYIEPRADSGDIILQRPIVLDASERMNALDYRFLMYKNIQLAVEMINEFLACAAENRVRSFRKEGAKDRLYLAPTRREFKRYYRLLAESQASDP